MNHKKKLLYASIEFTEEDTKKLQKQVTEFLESKGLSTDYKTINSKVHVTLCFYSDFKDSKDTEIFLENYKEAKEYTINISQVAVDDHCVALTGLTIKPDIAFYPEDKNLHVTMMLNERKPVYSNELIKRCIKADSLLTLPEPIYITGTFRIHYRN